MVERTSAMPDPCVFKMNFYGLEHQRETVKTFEQGCTLATKAVIVYSCFVGQEVALSDRLRVLPMSKVRATRNAISPLSPIKSIENFTGTDSSQGSA